MSLAGKVAVITGASTGIGESIAVLFAKEGAEVALVARNEEKLNNVAKQCNAFGKTALVIKAEFTKEDETGAVIPKVVERFGKIDILVNNAGAYQEGKILDGSVLKIFENVMLVNLVAPMLLTTKAAPYLTKAKGNVINISSISHHDDVAFGVSKAALDHFTGASALELGASGVRINSINPGAVKTEAMANYEGAEVLLETIKKRSILGKIIEPEEVAELALFLVSDKAKSITGEKYNLDNGFRLKTTSFY